MTKQAVLDDLKKLETTVREVRKKLEEVPLEVPSETATRQRLGSIEEMAANLRPNLKLHRYDRIYTTLLVSQEWEYFVETVCYHVVLRSLRHLDRYILSRRLQGAKCSEIGEELRYPSEESMGNALRVIHSRLRHRSRLKYWMIGLMHGQSPHWEEARDWWGDDYPFREMYGCELPKGQE